MEFSSFSETHTKKKNLLWVGYNMNFYKKNCCKEITGASQQRKQKKPN